MINTINRHGEITTNKNEALVTMPFHRLNTDDLEMLEENYRNKVKGMGYIDCFFYADSITAIRDRLQMTFDMTGAFDFHNIRNLNFEDMFPYFQSMIEMARVDVDILWEKDNFALDTQEERVKAFLFDFEGFRLYKKDNPLDGLKELILLALTNKESILGKPRRVDFIQQDERVIEFAEEILRCNSVEDVETICLGYAKEIEYERERERQEEEEKRQNSRLYKFKQKIKRNKDVAQEEIASTDEQLKRSLQKEEEKQNGDHSKPDRSLKDKMTTPKGMLVTLATVIVIGMVVIVAENATSGKADALTNAEERVEQQEDLLEVYRIYANAGDDKEREKAYAKIDALGYDNLPQEDQKILIDWYIKQDKMVKALTMDENSAYQIGNIMVDRDDGLDKLKEVSTQIDGNKVINFDIASLENEYQTMIENRNIEFNERRAKNIIEAYLQTNQKEELETFMDKIESDDLSSHENLQKHYEKVVPVYEEKQEIQGKIDDLEANIEDKKKEKDDAKKKKKDDIQDEIDDLEDDLDKKKEELERKNEKIFS